MAKKYLSIPVYSDVDNFDGMKVSEVIEYLKNFNQDDKFVDYSDYYSPDYRILTYRQETELEYKKRQDKIKKDRAEHRKRVLKIREQLIKDCQKYGLHISDK